MKDYLCYIFGHAWGEWSEPWHVKLYYRLDAGNNITLSSEPIGPLVRECDLQQRVCERCRKNQERVFTGNTNLGDNDGK